MPNAGLLLGILILLSLAGPPILPAQGAKLLVSLRELEARAARDSLDPLAHYDVALGYWVSKRYDDAERCLRRAAAIEPKMAAAYLGLAYLPYARRPKLWKEEDRGRVPAEWVDRLEESERLYRRAFMVDPMVDLKVCGLVVPPRGKIVVGRNATETYAALIQGFESFWDGQYARSFSWLQQALKRIDRGKPDDVPEALLWYYGLAAAHTSLYDPALESFRTLLARRLDHERTDTLVRSFTLPSNNVRYVLATIARRGGRTDEAEALYQETLANDLGLYMAHVQLADLYEERREWDRAIVERRRALDAHPEDPSLLFDLGHTLARALRFDEAAETLRQAMAANPRNPRVPYVLGLVLLRLGDRDGAAEVFRRFVAIAPSRFGPQVQEARGHLAALEQLPPRSSDH